MSKRVRFRCGACGTEAGQWAGQCSECREWNTLAPVAVPGAGRSGGPVSVAGWQGERAVPIGDVEPQGAAVLPTGLTEVDRVLGGGVVPGSVLLVGGEPGVGKSTLLLAVLAGIASSGWRVLYCTAEESAEQVRRRADRMGAIHPELYLMASTDLVDVVEEWNRLQPAVVVVDSVQTVHSGDSGSAGGAVGSVTQVRECTRRVVAEARRRGSAAILVGHVTKDGALAGPRLLEHSVDTVLSFEGDRHHYLRALRPVKHRFGSTQEVGLFRMSDAGLTELDDPSGLFLADRRAGLPGSVVCPVLDGRRPLMVEVQSLVVGSGGGPGRRSAQGMERGRVELVMAVVERRLGVSFTGVDTFVATVGGIRVGEPAADLAVGLALLSAAVDRPVPADLVAVGEVGLGGELRQVPDVERRLREAQRLGFRRAVVPSGTPAVHHDLEVIRATTLGDAAARAGLTDSLGSGSGPQPGPLPRGRVATVAG